MCRYQPLCRKLRQKLQKRNENPNNTSLLGHTVQFCFIQQQARYPASRLSKARYPVSVRISGLAPMWRDNPLSFISGSLCAQINFNVYNSITFILIHWSLKMIIHSSDTVFHAAGWSSNLQGDHCECKLNLVEQLKS